MPQEKQQNQRNCLPNHALEQILAKLPVQQRLGNCSLASRSLQDAAAAATTSIQLHSIGNQQQADKLCAWLSKHGCKALQHLDLEGEWNCECPAAVVNLPMQQLLQLRSLRVRRLELPLLGRNAAAAAAGQAAAASLSSLTRLTSLQLCTFSTSSARAIICWTARQIAPLTGLRNLNLHFSGFGHSVHSSSAVPNDALAAAVGQLLQLTSLTLCSNLHGAALATAGRLTVLQRLQLIDVGSREHPLAARKLPSFLTYLQLLGCSCEPGSWQLPALQELHIWDVAGFDSAALADLQQLSSLKIGGESGTPLDMESFLAQLFKLQNLQHLELHDVEDVADAASYAALTASSSLTALRLIDCSIADGAAHHMFAAGRQLQQLQQLQVDASEYAHYEYALGSEEPEEMQSRSLVLGLGDLQRLVTCCPRLEQLALIWLDGEASSAADDMRLLLLLTGLTGLSVAGTQIGNRAASQALARLTGEHGRFFCTAEASCRHVEIRLYVV
jgi:hypothetical protein